MGHVCASGTRLPPQKEKGSLMNRREIADQSSPVGSKVEGHIGQQACSRFTTKLPWASSTGTQNAVWPHVSYYTGTFPYSPLS